MLAQVLTRKGDRAEARTHLGHATSSDIHLPLAYQLVAQMDVQDGRLREARRVLERALAAEDAPPVRRDLRRAIALTYLHEGDLEETLSGYEALAADAEAANLIPTASGLYAQAAVIAAGAGDAARFDRYAAETIERRLALASVEWEIIGAGFLGRADDAADALRQDLLTRKDFSLFSTATPTARYRARHMK